VASAENEKKVTRKKKIEPQEDATTFFLVQ
jgi:hypothetical protein